MSENFQLVLENGVDAGSTARSAIKANYPSLPEPARTDLLLLVTELVTNAVRHARDHGNRPIQLDFRRENGCVHVRVEDGGTVAAPAVWQSVDGTSSGGWGLFLVDRIADEWGVSQSQAGTSVWAELSLQHG
jgi:anti-sigma regulatory factor (Ser/Thr protein kinase)